jgi:hypothetical protein
LRSRIALIAVGIALLTLGAALYLSIRTSSGAAAPAAPGRALDSAIVDPASDMALESPERQPSVVDEPVPVTSSTPTAVDAKSPLAKPEPIGDWASWPSEYATRPLEVLVADEAKLRLEAKSDMDAEIEQRFKDGRYVEYPQGSQPTSQPTFGMLVGRGDSTSIKYVNIDPRIDPQFFVKEEKANWLVEEIARRR